MISRHTNSLTCSFVKVHAVPAVLAAPAHRTLAAARPAQTRHIPTTFVNVGTRTDPDTNTLIRSALAVALGETALAQTRHAAVKLSSRLNTYRWRVLYFLPTHLYNTRFEASRLVTVTRYQGWKDGIYLVSAINSWDIYRKLTAEHYHSK